MKNYENILGIDIGSVAISIVEMNPGKDILKSAYLFHNGNIAQSIREVLTGFNIKDISGIASTTSTPAIIKSHKRYDNRISVITAAKLYHSRIGSILLVGGEKFGLIQFDDNGNYRKFKSNTSCAAGTGSFLDQQARRLNLSGVEELCRLAMKNRGNIPKIASRCSVFAKTDLIHAQQEGYSLEEICDGLCSGLAKNIADTLFLDKKPNLPLIFTGGVSKNPSVAGHLSSILDTEIVTGGMTHLYGAAGAATNLIDEDDIPGCRLNSIEDIIEKGGKERNYYHAPLELRLSEYTDFKGNERYEYNAGSSKNLKPVEVDIYEELIQSDYEAYLGIDIGSTSTKAVLLDNERRVLAGFYTRTVGRPIEAAQAVLEALDDLVKKKGLNLRIAGAGTTGSGRKLIGKILGADLIVDEITAHARAAYELDPEVDTIIEIGGQDSKFTVLNKGMVTFSIMNAVCAAGTGSFIEELSESLGCPLKDYSERTEMMEAPISSDRCTVFMERDINHYLSEGYSVDEVLASILHSIRDNYLTKVAIEGSIGKRIFFQGATAKNRALVAAFEQRLGRPILVSRFCHLTGALGAALMLSGEKIKSSGFRGIDLYKKSIPISSETCGLCTNHCKITLAEIDSLRVAYGFLCGRDYETKKYINNNRSGFDLIKQWKKIFHFTQGNKPREDIIIGIPAALHLLDDVYFWRKFFDGLSIKTVTSENSKEGVKQGKNLARAEFCSPISVLHAHAKYLLDKADYVFMPFYLENKSPEKKTQRQYCYYTQYSPAVVSLTADEDNQKRILSPLLKYIYGNLYSKIQIYRMLRKITKGRIGFFRVSGAYEKAISYNNSAYRELRDTYFNEMRKAEDISVVFVGRPYTILDPSVIKGIPEIFASMGVKAFYQDMLSYEKDDVKDIEPLLREIHWYYAAKILESAQAAARTEGLYPVLITSFKCAPDSFIIEYFKSLMESHEKPYLILQLDEHDSKVGYETRIESAVRAFRNHKSLKRRKNEIKYSTSLRPVKSESIFSKTLLIPNWDTLPLKFVVSVLRKSGIDARLMHESDRSIQKSLKYNTGQCIPMNAIAQDFIDYVEEYNLDPVKTALWMQSSGIACNIKLYPHHIKHILNSYAGGMEKAAVYKGDFSFNEVSMSTSIDVYFAFMFGGLLKRMGCRVRPYEVEKGATNRVIESCTALLSDAFLGAVDREKALEETVSQFEKIRIRKEKRPMVAIFGDAYARDNDVMNQGLINFIEENGGEALTMPYNYYVKMVSGVYFRRWLTEGNYLNVLNSGAALAAVNMMDKKYYRYFERILKEPEPRFDANPDRIISEYKLKLENSGESMDNIIKIYYTVKHNPDISLFIQTSPALCCPALITEAMAETIEANTGIPVVSITYDGTGGYKNDVIIPYLKNPARH